jgi:hypothetical protein
MTETRYAYFETLDGLLARAGVPVSITEDEDRRPLWPPVFVRIVRPPLPRLDFSVPPGGHCSVRRYEYTGCTINGCRHYLETP